MTSIYDILEKHLPEDELTFVLRHRLYGVVPQRLSLNLPSQLPWNGYSLLTNGNDPGRSTRLGICQTTLAAPTTASIQLQKAAALEQGLKFIQLAAAAHVRIFCFQELWRMPMGFCTGDKLPWVEFAEDPIKGETTMTLRVLAKAHDMVIISPMMEVNENGEYWNSAVVIDGTGDVVGVYRKTHLPINGNEMSYFQPSNRNIPVFQTKHGVVGVSICYDRHFPAHWHALKMGGAQVVFNPCASMASFCQNVWSVEGPAAAVANGFHVASINRAGTEEFTDSKGRRHEPKFGGSSYVASPSGICTPALPMEESGLLMVDVDLSGSGQVNGTWTCHGSATEELPQADVDIYYYQKISKMFKEKRQV